MRCGQSLFRQQELFFTGRAGDDVDRGKNPLVGELAAEHELAVTCAFELLEDDLIHAGAGVDEGGRNDSQRAAALIGVDLSRAAEETLWLLEGVGVETTGKCSAGAFFGGVVGAGEAGDGVEDDDDVLALDRKST